MVDKCIVRLDKLLKDSSIKSVRANEIINDIKIAQSEQKITGLENKDIAKISDDVLQRQLLQKKKDKLNAFENEIKVRNLTAYVLENFPENPAEGLQAILVGSNLQKQGSRLSAAVAQNVQFKQLVAAFNEKLRSANLVSFFAKSNEAIDKRVSKVIWDLGNDITPAEKNKDILELGKIMHEFSEGVRKKYNENGALIGKLPGWVVRQSHDPFQIRNAASVLGMKNSDVVKQAEGNLERNMAAWKEYIIPKLDEKTFDGYKGENRDTFLTNVYNSLVQNEQVVADVAENSYGGHGSNLAKKAAAKRVLHFKTSDDWFHYNSKFGTGNLREAFFSGLNGAGRNIGLMQTLGTNPRNNFNRIVAAVNKSMVNKGNVSASEKIKNSRKTFENQLAELDGSVNMIGSFGFAKWSGIARAINSMAKLGGATISAIADIHLYGTEVKHQGRSYVSGVAEAMGNLGKIKNTKLKKEIAEQLGFIGDNLIYDLAARYSVGDNLNKGFTNAQRTFFKLNLLSWWTNSLKEGAMLGMGNYIAKNRSLPMPKLNKGLQRLLNYFDIDNDLWDVLRKMAVEKAEDGTEFFSVKQIDNLPDGVIKQLMGRDKVSARQISLYKDSLRTKVSGMFLDRSTFAVIEPDARTRAFMKQGTLAGTGLGEAMRFVMQFKAFPFAIFQKAMGREMSNFKAGDKMAGIMGVGGLVAGSVLFGYMSMTAKDILRGKSPRDLSKRKTYFQAMLQGGGLGLYGDILFNETRTGAEKIGSLAGPVISDAFNVIQALDYLKQGKPTNAGRVAYKTVTSNIPFLNLFYIKTAFDYAIGYNMAETLSPGTLRRTERRMEKENGQEFLFTKPSRLFNGF